MTPETGTWDPAWRVPLIITVVLLSVLLSVLLFFAMVAWCVADTSGCWTVVMVAFCVSVVGGSSG